MRLITRRRPWLLSGLVVVLLLIAGLVALPRSGLRLPGATRATRYTNPVFDSDFPDPTVMRASDGWYYVYGTETIVDGRTTNIQVARSRDLVRWEWLGDALPAKPAWASTTQNFWAPDVSEHDGTFYLYFAAEPDTRNGMCLGTATAKTARGPFTDSGKPLRCGGGFANIDPMAFDDPQTGKRLLYWGSGFEPIRVQELAPDRLRFAPSSEADVVLAPISNFPYERLVEGAFVIYRDGYYYLFYSGDDCCNPDRPHYAVLIARSKSATGRFESLTKVAGKKSNTILQSNDRWIAPGHNSVIRDAAGQDWIFYHAINPNNRLLQSRIPGAWIVRRVMLIDRLVYKDGWPQIEGGSPSTREQQGPVVR